MMACFHFLNKKMLMHIMLTMPYIYFTLNFPIGIIHPETNMMKNHDLSKLFLQLFSFFQSCFSEIMLALGSQEIQG